MSGQVSRVSLAGAFTGSRERRTFPTRP